ncbi:MAG: thiamine phosphate synthase [Campylobacterota bacterium]|nr:thiamine phosphate synthase [Campylobacterota bacterium]
MIAYAITDPATLHFNTLVSDLERFSNNASMIVYRDKENLQYAECSRRFVYEAKGYDFEKVLLHSDYLLAKALEADGVHLTSKQFSNIKKAKMLGLFVVVSTHSVIEAQMAEALGADMITVSPVFETPGKGSPIGIEGLKRVIFDVNLPVIALGGIVSKDHINMCEDTGAKGFASIRYFASTLL